MSLGVTSGGDVFGGTQVTFTDVLGDQQFSMLVASVSQYRTMSFSYINLSRRLQYALQAFSQTQFYYGYNPGLLYDYNYGLINHALKSLGIIDTSIDFLGNDSWTMASMVLVGVFVSLPFTIFVFIAGLNAIPDDVQEAAVVDGASPWQRWRRVTLPLLRPALLVATVLNVIYVFNSFPIVYTLNDRNPGYLHDTTITFMYKLAFKSQEKDVGMSAAAGVINVLLILLVVAVYLKIVNWREETK